MSLEQEGVVRLADRFEREATSTAAGSRIHGPRHWRDVARVGSLLCVERPSCDRAVVLAFAAAHDSQRRSDSADRGHAARAAELVTRLSTRSGWPLDAGQTERLTTAVERHDQGRVSSDPTVGACWDADRLTLGRVGITPRDSLLSTPEGRALAKGSIVPAITIGRDCSWREIAAGDCPTPQVIRCSQEADRLHNPIAVPGLVNSILASAGSGTVRVYHGTGGAHVEGILRGGSLVHALGNQRTDGITRALAVRMKVVDDAHPFVYVTTSLSVAAKYAYHMAEVVRALVGGPFLMGGLVVADVERRRLMADPEEYRQWRLPAPVPVTTAYIVRFLFRGLEPPPVIKRRAPNAAALHAVSFLEMETVEFVANSVKAVVAQRVHRDQRGRVVSAPCWAVDA